jgi:hypothetical protein
MASSKVRAKAAFSSFTFRISCSSSSNSRSFSPFSVSTLFRFFYCFWNLSSNFLDSIKSDFSLAFIISLILEAATVDDMAARK